VRAGVCALAGIALFLAGWLASVPAREASGAGAAEDAVRQGREVYAAQCAVCHGSQGDGAGPAAHMLRVQPRDFRRGLFKFRSTPSGSLPTDEDLLRTVTEGVRWTGMVGRGDLAEGDRRAVVQYVKRFSPRFATDAPSTPVIVPPPPLTGGTVLEQGAELYREAGCGSCHGAQGRGDGPSAATLRDDWGWPTWPGDLSWRPLKRGSSPEGVYLTIATGLAGTPMPSYGEALGGGEIWALVHYLDSLVPGERRLPATRPLGEEPRGWMALRMGRMRGPGMMHPMPATPIR
jgi:cytochrome c oxidase cbb3-type subunit 2